MTDIVPASARPQPLRRCLPASVAALLLLGGCALAPMRGDGGPPALPLLSPASLGASVQAEQILHAAYGDAEHGLQCAVGADARTLSLVCLAGLGQRVFTLDYDGAALKTWRAPYAPDTIDPQRIVADLQLAYWPLAALQQAWRPAGADVVEPRPGLRRLLRDGRIVAEVHSASPGPWPARLWLVNLAYGYSLDIETHVLTP